MSARTIVILAPLAGWALPLAEVPDPVFAQGMAGEGTAIDPTGDTVLAPCDGEIVPMKGARHAVTVRHASGVEVLIHVGIDTVTLGGEGFELLVAAGERVRQGQALLRFDLDGLARRAPSLVTPVVIASGGSIAKRSENRRVRAGDVLMEVVVSETERQASAPAQELRRAFVVVFEHGLHVRPAAQVASALRPYAAQVSILAHGRSANARSSVAMMALGVHCGDAIEISAAGNDALEALAALEPLFAAPAAPRPAAERAPEPLAQGRIECVIASRGLASGPAVQWAVAEEAPQEASRGEAAEGEALRNALQVVGAHLAALAEDAADEHRTVLAGHAELLQDPTLHEAANAGMRRGKSAAHAWRAATRSTIAVLAAAADERMRERAADLRDLENQVLRVLAGKPPGSARRFAPGSIVLAEEILPSQFLALSRQGIAGICTASGGATSHVSILAAAAGLPTLVAAGPRILTIAAGTPLALDAEHGWLDVAPGQAEQAVLERAIAQRAAERSADTAAAQGPSQTRDGVRVVVNANLGSHAEVAAALAAGAEGCGLLRTEFLFLDRREAPSEDEQLGEYRRIAEALGPRPLAIRTLDAGGDKPIAYLPQPREDNPALGLRGVRSSLDAPELLATQLRAMMRVDASRLRILLPMVTDVEDVLRVRRMLEAAARELGVRILPPLGVMIETPSSALLAAQLAEVADFLSIGTNDLAQYTLAIDRGHPRLAGRLDALHPAVLKLIGQVAQAARARGKSVSVCGALGSDVDALPVLVGLGVHEISATAASIPRLKRTIRLLDASDCAQLAQRALEQSSAAAVRDLTALARARARSSAQTTPEGGP